MILLPIIIIIVFVPVYLLIERWERKISRKFVIREGIKTQVFRNEDKAIREVLRRHLNGAKPEIIVVNNSGLIFRGTAKVFLNRCT